MQVVIDRSWMTLTSLIASVVGILFQFIHAIVAKWGTAFVFITCYIAVFLLQGAVFFRKEQPSRHLVKTTTAITTIVTSWACLLLLYSFKADKAALLVFGSLGYVISQFITLYRLATLDIGKYKVLSSFNHSTVNLVGFSHMGCLFLGFVQAIVDAATTTNQFAWWVGPLSSIFSTILGGVSTGLLLYALHNSKHGLLKLARHGIMVTLITSMLVGVFTPTLFLSVLTQGALLVVSRNLGHQSIDDVNQPSFWQNATSDKLHFTNFVVCMIGVFLFLLPYEPDFAAFFDNDDTASYRAIEDLQYLAPAFSLIGESWIFTYLAVCMTFLAVGQGRHDVLLVARSFTTVAAGVSPVFALFTITVNVDHIATAGLVFKSIGVLFLWASSWGLLLLCRRDSMPKASHSSQLLSATAEEEIYGPGGASLDESKEHRLMGDETPPLQTDDHSPPAYNPDYQGEYDPTPVNKSQQDSIVMEEVDMDSGDLGSVALNEPEE